MELCETCKKTLCDKNMEIVRQGNLVTIRCLDYEKDPNKIQGYKKQLNRTARQCDMLMKLNTQKEKGMFEFKINNTKWTIKEVSEAEINNEMKNDYTMGVTIYKLQEILLLENQANLIKTLKHELTHVWLYEYGHRHDEEKKFDYEDICEIVASSNDFINNVVEQYKKQVEVDG